MPYIGDYDPTRPPLPGDVVSMGGPLRRFTLEDGWSTLDTFRGEWSEAVEYETDDVVVRGEALWIACFHLAPGTWRCIAGTDPNRGRDT